MTTNKFAIPEKIDIPPALGRNDVTRLLGISDSYFWKLLREGKLSGFYIGRTLKFHPEEVERFIEEGKQKFQAKYG